MKLKFYAILIAVALIKNVGGQENATMPERDALYIGPCTWILERKCPDRDVKFFLFTQSNYDERQPIHVGDDWESSNISSSFYDARFPVKIIVHGYNSDMQLTPLIDMKGEYLQRGKYNLFFVDWSVLGPAPCYPAAVHNTRHVGNCIAQLVLRLRDTGNHDIHLIGFSLGAQISNYVSTTLRNEFRLPRITGLDPAMPLFVTADIDNKLDESDAEFVDVFHTNALVQGKVEQCGHVDFYFNGGVTQPGCAQSAIFQCSHHRAPDYFAESIQSKPGFWGFKCQSYLYYLFGMCKPSGLSQTIAGEDCRLTTKGMFFISTNPAKPYALGRIIDEATGSDQTKSAGIISFSAPRINVDPLLRQIDVFGKLGGNFNNLPYSSDDVDELDNFNFFSVRGSDELSHNFVERLRLRSHSSSDGSALRRNDRRGKLSRNIRRVWKI